VVGFGSQQGIARFGQLLLDIGDPGSRDEYDLECEVGGFRGVASGSAELKICLPGSFGWEPSYGLD
jgi:hypothetical protein